MSGLTGRRVVVTRTPEDGVQLAKLLSDRGAIPVFLPTIVRVPPPDLGPLADAWKVASTVDRILVGSVAAVEAFSRFDPPPDRLPVACVGAETAARVRARCGDRFVVREVAETRRAEGLEAALVEALGVDGRLDGRRFLFPHAPEGRTALVEGLRSLGARVDVVQAYRIACAPPASAATRTSLDGADVFTFLSGRTLACFLDVVGEAEARRRLEAATVAVIGPVAAEAALDIGVRVDVVPPTASAAALVQELDRVV